MAVKCPQCDTDNPSDSKYCKECATPLPSSKEIPITKTLETPTEELTTGTTFAGRYQIIEELGKGGMGKVYRVHDKELKEEVALKLIKPDIASDKKTLERFSNELKLARKISHKNVGRMYELMEEKGTRYITMEYVPGEDLKRLIRKVGQFNEGKAVSIARQISEGLGEAHRLGVVHRDLKPQNIMVDEEGNARILDFGIARTIKGKGITGAGVMVGTPEYMSPEQAEVKEVDQRSDIYSLGVILYEMVTGRVPFEGETPLGIAMKHKSEIPEDPKKLNAQLSEDLDRLILKCLEKDKEKRYQNAAELSSELEKIERGIPTAERIVPERKPITSKEITVTIGLRRLLIPMLAILAVLIGVMIIWKPWSKDGNVPVFVDMPSIAVLPFEDISPKKDQSYLCEGLADSLINALTKIKGLRVPARTSTFSFRGKERNLKEIGEKLDVKVVLEGSLQKAGNRLRITAQLIEVADETLIWSNQYNRELDDVFSIQDEITLAIVDELKLRLIGEERENLTKRYTENVEAYNLYLMGRFFWWKRTEETLYSALEYFKQAIEIDPSYAFAYTGLADTYTMLNGYEILSPREAFPMAKEAVMKALSIDENLAEAHTSLAWVKMGYEWDWQEAEIEFQKAIKLNPNYALAHGWHTWVLFCTAQFDKALEEANHAYRLDPLNMLMTRIIGNVHFFARRYDKAVEAFQKTVMMAPDYPTGHTWLGRAYLELSQYEAALGEFQRALDQTNSPPGILTAATFAKMGKSIEAQEVLKNILLERVKEKYIAPVNIAGVYFLLGQKDQAFEWMEKAYVDRDFNLVSIKVDPIFDSVRTDPRYIALLKKIGLD